MNIYFKSVFLNKFALAFQNVILFREVGEIMTNGTKRRVAVSTVREAEFFADAGFDDIAYAYVFSADKLPR